MFGEIVCEFVDRTQGSREVDRAAFLARFPEHARALSEFFKGFDLLDALNGAPMRARMRRTNGGAGERTAITSSIDEITAEIIECSARGEHVAPEVYLARFPEHADSLRELFKGLDRLNALTGAPDRAGMRQAREVLPLLPEKDRHVIQMVHLEHRSMDEVAAEMGCSRDAAGKRLARALHRLCVKSAHGSRDDVR